ncbi:EcoKI restriction-modification system protein HsdS [compost metagenome]
MVQYWPELTTDIARYELEIGDLVIAMDGSLVGRSFARLSASDLPAVLLQRVARVRSKSIDIGFLTHQIASDLFVSYCDSVKTVTAIPHISSADIRGFVIPLPPTLTEQTAISNVLSDMDTELASLEIRRNKAHQLKQGMMQELLTGRIRLIGEIN